jgi:hypothetical protein
MPENARSWSPTALDEKKITDEGVGSLDEHYICIPHERTNSKKIGSTNQRKAL